MPRTLRAAPGHSSAGWPPSPGQSSGPWRPVRLRAAGPALQPGPAAGLGDEQLRKLQALFAHCPAQSLECPHLLRESFPGGSREPGPHLARVPATSVTTAQPVGLPQPVSSPPSPQSPHSSHGSGAPIGQASGPRLGMTEVTSEAWAPLTPDPQLGLQQPERRVGLGCHLGWVRVSGHLIPGCISVWTRASPGGSAGWRGLELPRPLQATSHVHSEGPRDTLRSSV